MKSQKNDAIFNENPQFSVPGFQTAAGIPMDLDLLDGATLLPNQLQREVGGFQTAGGKQIAVSSAALAGSSVSTFPTTKRNDEVFSKSSRLFPPIILEAERRPACDVAAQKARTPVLLDVFHDEVGPLEVIDARGTLRVVHRVGHVAHQDDVLAELVHLPDAEWPAEHAHV